MNTETKENLLWAWMRMSVCIRGNRLLSSMPFNEILVCNILYRAQKNNAELLTLTDLCDATRLYKSQVNRILTELEKKELIERVPSEEDKRKTYLKLVEKNLPVYFDEHEQVMQVVSAIVDQMGIEKVKLLTELMEEATDIVDQYQTNKE